MQFAEQSSSLFEIKQHFLIAWHSIHSTAAGVAGAMSATIHRHGASWRSCSLNVRSSGSSTAIQKIMGKYGCG